MRYDYLLTLFTGHDADIRPQLLNSYQQENFVVATDGTAIVVIDKGVCKENYFSDEKMPNAIKLFNEIERNCSKIVVIDDLFTVEAKFNVKYEYKRCIECGGEGTVMCEECKHEHECEECDGTGKIQTSENVLRAKVSTNYEKIKIGSAIFLPHLVDKLLNAMFILGVNECVQIAEHPAKGNIFKINEHCHVLIMPQLQPEGGQS